MLLEYMQIQLHTFQYCFEFCPEAHQQTLNFLAFQGKDYAFDKDVLYMRHAIHRFQCDRIYSHD